MGIRNISMVMPNGKVAARKQPEPTPEPVREATTDKRSTEKQASRSSPKALGETGWFEDITPEEIAEVKAFFAALKQKAPRS